MRQKTLFSGLIQAQNPINDANESIERISSAMLEKHLSLIEEAGKRACRFYVCKKLFNAPYFLP
jgi:beta-ureidopropionase